MSEGITFVFQHLCGVGREETFYKCFLRDNALTQLYENPAQWPAYKAGNTPPFMAGMNAVRR